VIFIILIISSCNPTKYVPQGETLLNDNHIVINREGIKKSALKPYIKQNPNERIFGTRFYLGLYNLSNINKEKWPHKWLRDIGEEPVIFDPYATIKSKEQIKSYVASKGYFDGQVKDTVETVNRKSDVYYNIDLLPAYTIRNLHYEIADSNIKKLCFFDSVNCVIIRGKPYDVDVLQAERSRFERFIKDHGFYAFSGEHINFRVDSTVGNRQVDIYYCVKNFTKIDAYNRISVVPHSVYKVKNIYIYPNFVPKEALEGGEAYIKSLDTINYRGYYFISAKGKPEIKYDLIIQSLYLRPGSIFNITNTEQSQAHLLTLKVYRLVNIYYNDSKEPESPKDSVLNIDCNIQLTLLRQQSYKVELEGTNSAGNLGGALNLIYQHKNLLHGAELFSMKLKGAYEAYSQPDSSLSGTQEYGFETSLRLPKFLIPFLKKESFIKKYNPFTTVLAAYDYQNLPFYTRTIANATFGYAWKAGSYQEHIVNPLQLNVVKLLSIDPAFAARIDSSSYLAYSYKDVMILGGSYSYIFNNQKIKKARDFWFLRINAETAGNMLALAGKLVGAKKTDSTYNILGQPYAQYVRTDLDLRYNYILNEVSSIVYRGFVGIGIPYGNSKALPFEKQYFGGGANGIRAWQVRSLGPGSYNPGSTTFLNQTADIKLEANAEYRFKLIWILEGALFLDAGNIWTYYDDPVRPGSQFRFNKFYKDIAVGTGTGFRFDFKFVLGRVDLGMKLRDPLLTDGSKWIIMRRPYNFKKDFALVLAIGYPF
jgi:outer membrane protein assembly factor BamA